MRLAIVRKRFNPYGGAERFIMSAVGGLEGSGVDVTIVTEAWDATGEANHRVVRVPKGGVTRAGRYRRFQAGVARALSEGRFDLVQTHERVVGAHIYRAGDGVHAAWVDRLARERGAVGRALMRLDPLHRLLIETERRMAADERLLFVANSALVARELRQWLGVPDARIRLIENGCDLDRFRPADAQGRAAARTQLGVPGDEPVIAFVGSGFERKGAFQLVRALAQSPLERAHLLVAGRDRQEKRLKSEIVRQGLGGRVRVLGGVSDVRPVLAAADVLALPSLYDPMPNAAIEALASGLPVVTTADTGIADAVAAARAGAVCARDPQALAAALGDVLSDLPARRAAALGLRASFDLALATQRWLNLYRELR